MANALDRVKAAEAKYTAMGETAEKLESTLKNFKGTADLCYAAMRELHREIKKDQQDQRWAFWWLVLVVGTVAVVGGIFGNFFTGGCRANPRCSGGLVGKLMQDHLSAFRQHRSANRYEIVTEEKASGATYTPKNLADFVAQQIIQTARHFPADRPLRVLDPAVGDGALLVSLLEHLPDEHRLDIEVYGFETDKKALNIATGRINQQFSTVAVHFELDNFLGFVLEHFGDSGNGSLFRPSVPKAYDLIIANPPYVRTQIMGASTAQLLAKQFGLTGRVDLYYAFILGMAWVLKPQGVAGIIVSNRFMTTRSGASVRQALLERFNIHHVWDLGDTKLFDAAVFTRRPASQG